MSAQWESSGDATADAVVEKYCITDAANKVLDLNAYKASAEVLRAVSHVLAKTRTLETLLLARNDIGDEGCAVLAEGIKQNRTVRNYYLGYNNITEKGMRALSQAWLDNPTVYRINLAGNKIGLVGARAIAAVVVKQVNITQLIVDDCGLSPEAVKEFERLITDREGMGMLSIWDNGIDRDYRKSLEAKLQGHGTLVSIDLPDPVVNMHLASPSSGRGSGRG
eukprot:TRINITY_DN6480_c0_g1_i4.p2 TRINITY_DN6480_c0_g1~~TRINITY_DN6480_c0_g1_i4.p2  ORF type:complete len:240 (-),score=25.95 TRINITY_DN6480_c0_g1_i4:370-1035(-)